MNNDVLVYIVNYGLAGVVTAKSGSGGNGGDTGSIGYYDSGGGGGDGMVVFSV